MTIDRVRRRLLEGLLAIAGTATGCAWGAASAAPESSGRIEVSATADCRQGASR